MKLTTPRNGWLAIAMLITASMMGCDSSESDNPCPAEADMEATIDGTQWCAMSTFAQRYDFGPGFRGIHVLGRIDETHGMELIIRTQLIYPPEVFEVLTLDADARFTDDGTYTSGELVGSQGSITVTEIDDNAISGTFDFVLQGEGKHLSVTDGVFEAVF